MVSFLYKHARYLYTLDGDTHNPIIGPNGWAEDIRVRDCRPLHSMEILRDHPYLLLVGRRRLTVDDTETDERTTLSDTETETQSDGADSSSDRSGDDSSSDGFNDEAAARFGLMRVN